jgi:hypothetical protein
LLASEKVFVNTQHSRASVRMPLPELTRESVPEVALDSRCTDTFAPAQPAAVDAIQMLLKDHCAEGFAGPLARQNPRKALPELASAIAAQPLPSFQLQHCVTQPDVFMPHPAKVLALASHMPAAAMHAGDRPFPARSNPDLPTYSLNPGNLVSGQSQQYL